MKLEWDYGYKVPDERRKGYTHLIRARSDPDERVKRGKAAGYDPQGWRKLSKQPISRHEKRILKLLDDGKPRTFNRIGVEIWGRTADMLAATTINDALWNLVEKDQVEHDLVAPILFRARRPKKGRKKPAPKDIMEDKERILEKGIKPRPTKKKKARPAKKRRAPREPDLIELARKARKNPNWVVDGHEVHTRYDVGVQGWFYQIDGVGKWHGSFIDEHEAIRAGIAAVAELPKPLFIVGDDPLRHDGGVVYQRGEHYFMRYFQTYGDDKDKVMIYTFPVEKPYEDLDWVDWQQLASSMDCEVEDIESAASSDKLVTRANVYLDVGMYYGFSELDSYADSMSFEEANEQYGRDIKAAHEEQRRELYSNPDPLQRTKARMLAWAP